MTRDPRTDEALLAAHVAGDATAFPELVLRWTPIVAALVRRGVDRPQDANELVQDTFLHLHRSARDFRAGAPLRPWLVTIALNTRREYQRRRSRRPEERLEVDGRQDPVSDPRTAERVEAARTAEWALNQLPEPQRAVIELHWYGGLGFPEIGQVVGASTGAVKVRAHRGYERMRELLSQRGAGGETGSGGAA